MDDWTNFCSSLIVHDKEVPACCDGYLVCFKTLIVRSCCKPALKCLPTVCSALWFSWITVNGKHCCGCLFTPAMESEGRRDKRGSEMQIGSGEGSSPPWFIFSESLWRGWQPLLSYAFKVLSFLSCHLCCKNRKIIHFLLLFHHFTLQYRYSLSTCVSSHIEHDRGGFYHTISGSMTNPLGYL